MMRPPMSFARVCVLCVIPLLVCSCGEPGGQVERDEVVLYSSVDGYVLQQFVSVFESNHDIDLRVVGDTEATKTTGLVERLMAEKGDPVAHVWWSSEPFGSIRLAEEAVLQPYEPPLSEKNFPDGWPDELKGEEGRWYSFGQRARVIAYHRDQLDEREVPRTLADLARSEWRGRVGIAKPQFGTTRGHMGALYNAWGGLRLERWLEAMKANGLRIYDGNAAVVAAIRNGEIDLGLTDTDDVWHAQRNGWPIEFVYEAEDDRASPPSMGALLLPNTVGLVSESDPPEAARELLSFILSRETELLLATSDSRNFPVFPAAKEATPNLGPEAAWEPDLDAVAESIGPALDVVERVLGP